jgi:hypothetical protein
MGLPDPFEELVRETLAEEMGPPPSRDLWKQIASRITEPPPYRSWRSLLPLLRAPLFHSALMVALLAWVVVQPAYHWMQQERPVHAYYSLEGDLVPPSAPQRPRPVTVSAGDLIAPVEGLLEGASSIQEHSLPPNRVVMAAMSSPLPRQAPDGEVRVPKLPGSEEPAALAVAALPTTLPRAPESMAE